VKLVLLAIGVLATSSLAGARLATPVWAEPGGASAIATAHALEELKNAIAQGKTTLTPTPTASVTEAPATPTATLAPAPTDTPEPAPSVPPPPPPPVPDRDRPIAAYVRPSPRDSSGTWLELALPQGRWAVLYDSTVCTPPAAWTNVWLALDSQNNRPITANRDDDSLCAVSQWSWTSSVPCAEDDQGLCDMQFDGAYWDTIGQVVEPTATDTPIPTTTPEPTPRPPVAPAAAEPPRAEVVVQTVVVVVTAVPTDTPIPTRTAAPTPTPGPTRIATVTPLSTNTPTLEPTSTEVPLLGEDVSATDVPSFVAQADDEPTVEPTSWNWPLTFVVLAIVLGLLAIWLFVARSGPVMW
jgi:hypothetical protein